MLDKHSLRTTISIITIAILISASSNLFAQERKPMFRQGPVVNSPEVQQDGSIIFRILAPEAVNVGLQSSDMFGMQQA